MEFIVDCILGFIILIIIYAIIYVQYFNYKQRNKQIEK